MRTASPIQRGFIACAIVLGFASPALAQVVPDSQLGTASPGRVEKQQLNLPETPTEMLPNIEVKPAAIEQAPPGAEKIMFTLKELNLEGVTAYSSSELQPVYQDSLNKTISLADLYEIAATITRKYRNDGYILTQVIVPPQTIETGSARLQVVEGYVADVTVQSDVEDKSIQRVRSYASRIKSEGGAVNVKDIERWMLMINDLPGVKARGVLSPSRNLAGASDMVIVVERKKYDALVSVDNYGSRYLGPVQTTAAGSLNSVFGWNEKITAQAVVTPMNGFDPELAYGSLGYEQPVTPIGTLLKVFGSRIYTDPGFDLQQFDVKGRSDFLSLGLAQPILRSRALNLAGRAAFDYRNVQTTNNIEPKREDHIRALRLGGRLDSLESLLGVAHDMIDVELAHGVDIFDGSEDSDNTSRPDADPDFTKLNAELQRLQRVTSQINILLGVEGQISNGPLYSSEEFGVGGSTYGHGYDPSEITGDEGVAAKMEVQWNEPYSFSFLDDYQLFGFYEVGKVWNDDATTSAQKSDSLASAGGGIRLDLPMDVSADATLAFPLTRDVQTENGKDTRLLFSLSKSF